MTKEGRSIEGLKVWQKARELAKSAYDLSNSADIAEDKDIKTRLRSLSLSILTNVTKGYERRAKKDFVSSLMYAKGACFGFQAFLYLLRDLGKISQDYFDKLLEESVDIVKMSSGLIKTLQGDKKATV